MTNYHFWGVVRSFSTVNYISRNSYLEHLRSLTDIVPRKKYSKFIKKNNCSFYGQIGEHELWLVPKEKEIQLFEPVFRVFITEKDGATDIKWLVQASPLAKFFFFIVVLLLAQYIVINVFIGHHFSAFDYYVCLGMFGVALAVFLENDQEIDRICNKYKSIILGNEGDFSS